MQQILAYETDLLEYGDLFDGSKVMDAKVEALKAEAKDELKRIEAMGGAVAAVESGYMKQQLVESNTARLEAIERGEQTVVGVNKFLETEPSPLTGGVESILTVPEEAEIDQIERLKAWRAQRDNAAVKMALAELKRAAAGQGNIMPASIACAKAGVTTGEWGWTLREAFGEYRAPTGVGRRCATMSEDWTTSGPTSTGCPEARASSDLFGRQARPRRPLQRRRADRGARARRRHAGGLRGHPPDARGDRRRRAASRRRT